MKSILDTAQNLMSLGLHGMAAAYERQLETPALLKERNRPGNTPS